MTTQKHKLIVRKTLEKWFPTEERTTIDRVADAIVNRFETAVELELEEREEGVVVDFNALRNPGAAARPMEEILPPPPPDQPQPSLIVDPSSPEAKEAAPRFRANKALKLPTNVPKSKMSQDGLRQYLEVHTPDPLLVRVEERAQPVALRRNIVMQLGVDTVKLIYGLEHRNEPTSSAPNTPEGELLAAMSVDTPIAMTIDCERLPDVESILTQMSNLARHQFKPKPGNLASATPRRAGMLSFRADDPHDEVGPMTNPVNGRVW